MNEGPWDGGRVSEGAGGRRFDWIREGGEVTSVVSDSATPQTAAHQGPFIYILFVVAFVPQWQS